MVSLDISLPSGRRKMSVPERRKDEKAPGAYSTSQVGRVGQKSRDHNSVPHFVAVLVPGSGMPTLWTSPPPELHAYRAPEHQSGC